MSYETYREDVIVMMRSEYHDIWISPRCLKGEAGIVVDSSQAWQSAVMRFAQIWAAVAISGRISQIGLAPTLDDIEEATAYASYLQGDQSE